MEMGIHRNVALPGGIELNMHDVCYLNLALAVALLDSAIALA